MTFQLSLPARLPCLPTTRWYTTAARVSLPPLLPRDYARAHAASPRTFSWLYWADKWHTSFNASKTVHMLFLRQHRRHTASPSPILLLDSIEIPHAESNHHLGVTLTSTLSWSEHNAPLAIRYPPDIRPRPLPGLIFSNIRPRSVTNWISTCGLNRFATCSLRSAECHRVKPTANLLCVNRFASLVKSREHSR